MRDLVKWPYYRGGLMRELIRSVTVPHITFWPSTGSSLPISEPPCTKEDCSK